MPTSPPTRCGWQWSMIIQEYRFTNSVPLTTGTNELTEIKKRVEKACEATFNSVLLNRYRDGRDSVSWHADDETALGEQPVIVSVSLGASRQFQMKHRFDTSQKCSLTLENGSALVMRGATQQYWLHQIPKTRKIVGERINLTFRLVKR